MVLGKVSHSYLFVKLGGGEVGLPELSMHARGREESQAHFPFFLDFLVGPPYELFPFALVQERCF